MHSSWSFVLSYTCFFNVFNSTRQTRVEIIGLSMGILIIIFDWCTLFTQFVRPSLCRRAMSKPWTFCSRTTGRSCWDTGWPSSTTSRKPLPPTSTPGYCLRPGEIETDATHIHARAHMHARVHVSNTRVQHPCAIHTRNTHTHTHAHAHAHTHARTHTHNTPTTCANAQHTHSYPLKSLYLSHSPTCIINGCNNYQKSVLSLFAAYCLKLQLFNFL